MVSFFFATATERSTKMIVNSFFTWLMLRVYIAVAQLQCAMQRVWDSSIESGTQISQFPVTRLLKKCSAFVLDMSKQASCSDTRIDNDRLGVERQAVNTRSFLGGPLTILEIW